MRCHNFVFLFKSMFKPSRLAASAPHFELIKTAIELKWRHSRGRRCNFLAACGALLKGSITVSGGAILRKQALALPFR